MNVSDLLLKSEEESRKNRDRGEITGSLKDETELMETPATRDSVVEFASDTNSQSNPMNTKKKTRKRPSKKTDKNSSNPQTSISFFIGDHEISPSSLIFEALYKYEQEKTNNYDLNPNVWNQTYTVTYKKTSSKPRLSSSVNSTLSSEGSVHDIHLPFRSYHDICLNADQETISVLRLLGILNEFNSRHVKILDWINDYTGDVSHIFKAPPRLFINSKITAKMKRQLDEPLIVASRVLPRWCNTICYDFPFLLPFDSRLTYLQIRSFGYSRNMARWQQMASSASLSPNGAGSILGRIQRQKIRISRRKILESMIKAMELYGSTQALLEVEFFDEVGTGLGPTLEFFSQVCLEIRRSSGFKWTPSNTECCIWRNDSSYRREANVAEGHDYLNVLFPHPYGSKYQRKYFYVNLIFREISGLVKSIGTLVAKALLDSRTLDLPFSPVFIEMSVFGPSTVSKMTAIKVHKHV